MTLHKVMPVLGGIALLLAACNLSAESPVEPSQQPPEPTTAPTQTTAPDNPPTSSNSGTIPAALSISPVVEVRDGRHIASPGALLTISWPGIPEGTTITFTEHNFLVDGGVRVMGEVVAGADGASISYTMPAQITGSIEAEAALPNGSSIQAIGLPIQTVGFGDGACMVTAPAVGPGQFIFAEPNLDATPLAEFPYTGDGYTVIGKITGTGDKPREFYEISFNGQRAYVFAGAVVMHGDCSAYAQ